MPLDGTAPWSQPLRWTIRVGLAPRLRSESRHWSRRKLRVFHRLAADAVYAAIDAIQRWDLHTRREDIRRRGSWVLYLFKVDLATRTIHITISEFHFHDPAPTPDPGQAQGPQRELIVDVFGSGRLYTIERVQGFLPLPRPPARNSIIEHMRTIRSKFAIMRDMPRLNGSGSISPIGKRVNGTTFYSQRGFKTLDHANTDLRYAAWLYEPSNLPRLERPTNWLRALNIFASSPVHAPTNLGRTYSQKSIKLKHFPTDPGNAVDGIGKLTLSRLFSLARSPRANQPVRPLQ